MNTIDADTTKPTKRFGLIPARIGSDIAHTLGIKMPLEEPMYSPVSKVMGGRTRTTAISTRPHYAYSSKHGAPFPTEALPGAVTYLTVQDITRIEPELVEQAYWFCNHHACAGKKHASRETLARAHAKQKDLIEEANRDPRGGSAHLYYAVMEVSAVPEAKDEKTGKVTRPYQPAIVIVASDEE